MTSCKNPLNLTSVSLVLSFFAGASSVVPASVDSSFFSSAFTVASDGSCSDVSSFFSSETMPTLDALSSVLASAMEASVVSSFDAACPAVSFTSSEDVTDSARCSSDTASVLSSILLSGAFAVSTGTFFSSFFSLSTSSLKSCVFGDLRVLISVYGKLEGNSVIHLILIKEGN